MKPYKDSILLEIVRVNNFGSVSDLIKEVTTDLTEDLNFPDITKGSKYRKQAFNYASCLNFGMQMKKNKSLNKKELTKEILTKVEDGITYLILLPL